MRRIIHNTTAIAACLSLLMPHMALAQDEAPARPKDPIEILQNKIKAAADSAAGKPADAVKPGQEAPPAKKAATGKPARKPAAEKPARKPAAQQGGKDNAVNAPAKAERQGDGQQRPAKKSEKADPAKKDARKAEAKKKAAEKKQESREKAAERKEKARKKAAEKREDAAKKQAGQQAKQKAQDKAKARKQDRAPARANRNIRLRDSETAEMRARSMGRLSRVLGAEMESGLTTGQLKCLSGEGYPCPDRGLAITPRGVVLKPLEDGSFIMAANKDQMYRVGDDDKLVERVAEEGAVETEAAREAASATATDLVAALTSRNGRGEVVEQKVTKENSRSSSEDFSGNLRDALSAATGQRKTAKPDDGDDNDDNDLTKALLLGLGAVAVGSMLGNNREVALSSPDRVVVTRADGSQEVIKDEVALLREPGSTVATRDFDDGSSRTVVTRSNGSKVVTIRDSNLRVLRRTLIDPDGTETVLIDDTAGVDPVDIDSLPSPVRPVEKSTEPMDEAELRAALQREADIGRRFTLAQIRNIPQVRALVAPVNIDAVTFETGSAAIKADQAQQLATLGNVIQESIRENPREIFLIEGHTDTVGADAMNLALSDRRAESVALALSEYFDVPPENLVVQGYGEQYLKVRSEGDIRENRRASVRRITELLQTAASQ